MSSEKIANLDSASFEETVKNAAVPVVVDFWAPWCGPCKAIAPVLDQIADEFGGAAKICKVNVDENLPLAQTYGVQNIPTILFFKGGQLVDKIVGSRPKAELVATIKKHQ